MAALAVAKPPLKGLRLGSAQWLTARAACAGTAPEGQGHPAARERERAHHRLKSQQTGRPDHGGHVPLTRAR